MNEQLKKLGVTTLPGVNLLPKDIAEKRKLRAVQVTALLAILIAVAVVALVWFGALGAKQLAEDDLRDRQRDQTLALAARDAKAHVYSDYLQQEQEEFTLAQIGYGEVLYSEYAPGVLAQADEETSFQELTFFGPSALGLGGVSTDPVFGGGVGTMVFAARADSLEAATALIARLEEVPGLARVWGRTEAYGSERGSVFYLVEGEGVITSQALTMRLVPEDGLTGLDPTLFADPEYDPEAQRGEAPEGDPEEDEEN